MLFQIDRSIADLFTSGSATSLDVAGLRYLVLGSSEGSHKITGQRKTLTDLAQAKSIDVHTRNALARAEGQVYQDGPLSHKLRVVGQVVAATQTTPSSSINGAQRVITFPLRWFDSSAKIQPTALLGENSSDAYVFLRMGETGTILTDLGYLPIVARCTHGGGNTTGAVLDQIVQSGQLCLCIVDSDKKSPSGPSGGTAQAVAPYKNAQTYPLAHVEETVGRDLENSLPDLFYVDAYGTHPSYNFLAELLMTLSSAGEIDVRNHLDIENGLKLHDLFSLTQGTSDFIFWQNKLNSVIKMMNRSSVSLPCLSIQICSQQSWATCTCVLVPPNRANILNEFLRRYQNADRYKLRAALDDSVRPEWLRLGGLIAAWCCADLKMRL